MGYLRKGDIRRHRLLRNLLYRNVNCFPEKRFRFLAGWDPQELTRADDDGYLPLHGAAIHSTPRGFLLVLEALIRYFPKKKGISCLFQNNVYGKTPFKSACGKYGREKVLEGIESILIDCSDNLYDTSDVLALAAVDEKIDLDCVYFLLRREPDALAKLLSATVLSRQR